MSDDRPLILVTGAAGRVASQIRPYLPRDYRLRLTDTRAPDGPRTEDDEVLIGDLEDADVVASAVRDVRAVVHLAGNGSPGADWPTLQRVNVGLTHQLLEIATNAGVERVILASSVHATGQYVRDHRFPIDPSLPPAPCCLYGASKVCIEAMGSVYAHRHGLGVTCLRIGAASARPRRAWGLRSWVSPRDLAHIVDRSIASRADFGIYYAVSNDTRSIYRISNARQELGYEPVSDAEDYRAELDDDGGPPCFGPCPG